mgnify:FL=1
MKFKSQLMTTDEIMRALRRIAHQIIERNNGVDNVIIVGIAKGGVPIANQLSEFLKTIEQRNIPTGVLDISGHRDDIEPQDVNVFTENESIIPCDINGKHVVLVDDVLYTGRTARAAFDALSDYGRAGTIQLAVLIDRGHRELPIRADYVGKNIPTSHVETIRIDFDETGTKPVVNIYNR